MTRRAARRRAVQALLALVATSTLLVASPASGQEGTSLGGFQGTAAASGLKVRYLPVGLLPTGAPVDLGVPDAYTTISTGPATFARASVADPGDVLANPNALIGQLDPNAPRVPEYPFRATATSSFGDPEARSSPAPGLDARVKVAPDASVAEATTPKVDAPGIADLGSLRSVTTTETDGSTVTVRARSEVSSFNLLDLITIDSIVTEVTATSDGTTATAEGGTTISGAEIAGQPVIIDADGVHADPDAKQSNPLVDAIGNLLGGTKGGGKVDPLGVLEQAGIEITAVGPRELETQGAAELAASGLRIDIDATADTVPLLADLIEGLPPIDNPIPGAPVGVEDILAVLTTNHLVAIELGGASVSLDARPAFVPEPFESPAPAPTPASPAPAPSTGSVSSPSSPTPVIPSTPSAPSAAPATSPVAETTAPAASLSAGIGVLALVALLLQPLIGDRLARGAAAILGADQPDICPREGQ